MDGMIPLTQPTEMLITGWLIVILIIPHHGLLQLTAIILIGDSKRDLYNGLL